MFIDTNLWIGNGIYSIKTIVKSIACILFVVDNKCVINVLLEEKLSSGKLPYSKLYERDAPMQ